MQGSTTPPSANKNTAYNMYMTYILYIINKIKAIKGYFVTAF